MLPWRSWQRYLSTGPQCYLSACSNATLAHPRNATLALQRGLPAVLAAFSWDLREPSHVHSRILWKPGSLRDFTCKVQLGFWRFASRRGLLPCNIRVARQSGKQFSTVSQTLGTRLGSRVPIHVWCEDDCPFVHMCE